MRAETLVCVVLAVGALSACSGEQAGVPIGQSGAASVATGGTSSGGSSNSTAGGVTASPSGGAQASGGLPSSGVGGQGTGGAVSSNGGSSGAASGGTTANGGTSAGGITGSSGAATGGSSGGSPSTGGTSTSTAGAGVGGSSATGGNASAGSAGASTTSGGSSSGGAGSGVLFSDDFEASAIDSRWIPKLNGNGKFTLDKAQKHGGTQGLHVSANGGYSTLMAIEGAPLFPAPSNTFYGRVWFRVPQLPSGHVIWLEAGLKENDKHEVRIGMHLGFLQTNLWKDGEVDLRDPKAAMKAGTWQCLEFKMGNDDLEVWLDGVRSDGVSTKNWVQVTPQDGGVNASSPRSNWTPTYESFRLGWELNGAEISYDDVALGHSRIGCN